MKMRRHPEYKKPVQVSPQYLRLHLKEPDYTGPLLEITEDQKNSILDKLSKLYGPHIAEKWYPELERRLRVYYAYKTPEMIEDDARFKPEDRFTEKDIIIITYGDLLVSPGKRPLQVLHEILSKKLNFSTTIHILPFFPYSSDRGFAVKSYFEVDTNLGRWDDIEKLGQRFELMFDGVINHISAKSHWFQEFLNGNPEYEDFFIRFSTDSALSNDHKKLILRPRTSDLLTRFDTISGPKLVWTTFSPDQVDLNYKNIMVLLRVIEVLLYYVRRGADLIRLDAVTYLWTELGTTCAHLEQTHLVIQLFKSILDAVAPQVALITETNVPHSDNISYFGSGDNEARMVYNFALPPMTLFSFYSGNCRKLSEWAASLEHVSDTATYFNFLDSHDGIGLLPATDILTEEEVNFMVQSAQERGGMVSYRTDKDGNKSPYELNITWFSALNSELIDETMDAQIDRFVASRCVALVLMGVPGIYLPSLIGSRNDVLSVTKTGEARSINRKTFDAELLKEMLEDHHSSAARILRKLSVFLNIRIHCPAFHPNGKQKIIIGNDHVFSVVRTSPDQSLEVLTLTNVTNEQQTFVLKMSDLDAWPKYFANLVTGITKKVTGDEITFTLNPYQVKWITGQMVISE